MIRLLPSIWILLVTCLASATPVLGVSQRIIVTVIDGQQQEGEVAGWDKDSLTLKSDGASVEVSIEELLNIRPAEKSADHKQLASYAELIDGAQLPLSEFTVSKREATIATPLAEQLLTLPTDQIGLVQFTPRTETAGAFWDELAQKRLPGDVLVVQKGEPEQLDYLSGVLGDVTKERVEFRWEGEAVPVKRNKISAMAYYHAKPSELPEPLCWISTRHGARIPATEVEWDTDEKVLRITSVLGLQFSVPIADWLESDYAAGKLIYLSDLTPLRQRWTPRIDLPASAELIQQYGLPRRDQSYTGSSLSLRWPAENPTEAGEIKSFAKGLALRSRTLLEYRIPSGMTRFVALAGIDPATASQGNVALEVSADGILLWKGEIDGGSAPVELDVPLGDARRLQIFVDYGTNLDYGDRLHLVDARLTK